MLTMNALAVLRAIQVNMGYYPTGWVPMGAIRDTAQITAFDGMSGRQAFDRAMAELVGSGIVAAVPEENQKTITETMMRQGCFIGGERKDYATL